MPTTREVEAGKAERLRRARRFYTRDLWGPPCLECGFPTAKPLVDQTQDPRHPCCAEPAVMAADTPPAV